MRHRMRTAEVTRTEVRRSGIPYSRLILLSVAGLLFTFQDFIKFPSFVSFEPVAGIVILGVLGLAGIISLLIPKNDGATEEQPVAESD